MGWRRHSSLGFCGGLRIQPLFSDNTFLSFALPTSVAAFLMVTPPLLAIGPLAEGTGIQREAGLAAALTEPCE